ncbi:MAG: FGGY-family carbohydrate kinase [Candidatus Bathyarchaeia archaeon]
MSYLIGSDIGTFETKTILIDSEGAVLSESFKEYGLINPKQGWAEQWPDVWTRAVFETIHQVIEKSKIDTRDIAGLCISSLYGGSGIPCDKEMRPLRPCIIWADRRSIEECRWIKEKIGVENIFKITGNIVDPYYGYTKMIWIRNHEPDIWGRIYRIMTPNAYCIQKITGEESVDFSSAGNYGGFFDIHRRDWSSELMEDLKIPRGFFPEEISPSEKVVGEINSEGAEWTGLEKGTPVCAGGIDAPMSTLGGGAIYDGDLVSMLGTSMCNGFLSHTPRISPKLVNFPYVINGKEFLYSFTGIITAGYCVRWFRDEFGELEKRLSIDLGRDAYSLLDDQAECIPAGSDGLLFLPHMMGGERAPYWDDDLRGAFLGASVNHTRPHFFRAVLEGVAYALRYSMEAAKEAGFPLRGLTLIDGGAKSKLWRQIIADVIGLNIAYIPEARGAPLGDALLAGLGTGVVKDFKKIIEWVGRKIKIEPNIERYRIYEQYYNLYKEGLENNKKLFIKMRDIGI